ncbi:DUF3124 domain-containing protein [Marinirhabdus gelatinilytica]|uniref:Uncharacterized protein DUF3124 n=1 Tax=Marinirhabdus gelatinilytica TaxID=1703343 RepID=A0A370QB03_9FLAO|nr:DUF3124 domain-containing protein [Marinirhabdus gelatinilytica]RDK85537.1 uncharacterized protein DUF3124 [Marinirhabdus gelatinilytica]
MLFSVFPILKKLYFIPLLTIGLLFGCETEKQISSVNPENWSKRMANMSQVDSLEYGKSYLSIYSQIYSLSEHTTHNLTAMVSMRNTSEEDTIYILRAEYFDSHGRSIRNYFKNPIYLAPLETTDIVIDELDITGGTGANFIFEWNKPHKSPEPLFEGVMNSTMGQQGLSFTTQAKRIE